MSDLYIAAAVDDAGLDPFEFRLVCRVARRGELFESVPNLAERLQMGHSTVRAALQALVAGGVLQRTRRTGRTTVYRLRPVEAWRPDIVRQTRQAVRGKDPRSKQSACGTTPRHPPSEPPAGGSSQDEEERPTPPGFSRTPLTDSGGAPLPDPAGEGTPQQGPPIEEAAGPQEEIGDPVLGLSAKDECILHYEWPRLKAIWGNTQGDPSRRLEAIYRACWGRRPNATQRRHLSRLLDRWPAADLVQAAALAAAAGKDIDTVDAFIKNRSQPENGTSRRSHETHSDEEDGRRPRVPEGLPGRTRTRAVGKKRDGELSRREWLVAGGWTGDRLERLDADDRLEPR